MIFTPIIAYVCLCLTGSHSYYRFLSKLKFYKSGQATPTNDKWSLHAHGDCVKKRPHNHNHKKKPQKLQLDKLIGGNNKEQLWVINYHDNAEELQEVQPI